MNIIKIHTLTDVLAYMAQVSINSFTLSMLVVSLNDQE